MEDNETIENMFSSFLTLVAGLKVLDKGYSTADHVKKIIISLPKRWRPTVTVLKLSKDLNNTTLKELVSSLRSHKIKLEEDEPQRKVKYVALKSMGKSEKTKAFQAEEDDFEEDSEEDDELSLLFRHFTQLWKKYKPSSRLQKDMWTL